MQRVSTLMGFFSSYLLGTLAVIAAINYVIHTPPPSISLTVENVGSRLGVEDYFMNRKVLLTDFVMNLEAGKFK